MVDRVRAYKQERPQEGGTQTDEGFTEVDIGQDYLDAAGLTLQRPGANTQTADAKVRAERTATDDLQLSDPNAGTLPLQKLLTSLHGLAGSHSSLADIIHWLGGGGPGDGFASGAYMAVTVSGLRPTGFTWYASQAQGAAKLFAVAITYQGLVPASVAYTLYANGVAVRTLTDTFAYTNAFYPNAVRTY